MKFQLIFEKKSGPPVRYRSHENHHLDSPKYQKKKKKLLTWCFNELKYINFTQEKYLNLM